MDISAIDAGAPLTVQKNDAAIDRKAKEFEAVVLGQLLKPMFETVKTSSLFGGDGGEHEVFKTMMTDTYANAIAERGGVGIADQVKSALIALQSSAQG